MLNFLLQGNNAGVDTVTLTFANVPTNVATITWVTNAPVLTSSAVTGSFFPADGSGAFNTLATAIPAFTQVFPGVLFNTGTVPRTARPFTNVVVDRAGAFAGTIPAQGLGYQAGIGPLYNFSSVFTGVLSVPSAGQRTFTITSDDAFVFGMQGATRVSGPAVGTPVVTAFKNYAVMGGVNNRQAPAPQNIVVNFPAAGTYAYELDYAKGGDNQMTLTMLADGAPIGASALLTLNPAAVPSTTAGQIAQLTLTARDGVGNALANLPVIINVSGQNEQIRSQITDGAGNVPFAYIAASTRIGLDTIQAVARVGNVDVYSNIVTLPWNSGVNTAPVVSAGTGQTVQLPGTAILTGSVTDDALPLTPGTVSTTWTMVSGPANAVFDSPSQISTAVNFPAQGSYVLRLTASDGALTSTSDVTVTVSNPPSWSSGWIANPPDESGVTGVVPITLVPGITLTSGTLTYYPANNQAAVVTLNANTTGTGQIGSFDTTLLANGAYFIQLRGTNSVGVTQNNLVYVKVIGDYKPGRVTSSITDLTVPAPGLPIQIQRVYDSLERNTSSDFGFGWKLGIQVKLETSPTSDVTLTVGGKRRTFYFTPPSGGVFTYWYTPKYTGEAGFYGSLTTTGDNCSGVLVRAGSIWQCGISNAGAQYAPTAYKYTDPYGRAYVIASNGNIQSVTDLNGNTLTVTAAGISSTNGLSVPFVRDGQGRITRITDPLGRQFNYTYDPSGNLATVAYPAIATPAQYTYDTTHLLTQEKDQRGNIAGTTTYFADGKLKSVTDAVGNLTQFTYDTAIRSTTVTNPDGGTAVSVTDAYGSLTSVTDPLGRITTNVYDANHNVTSMTDPLGKTTTYTYDANGFRTLTKDPLNNQQSATYNAVGGPVTLTNPLGQVTNVSYDVNFRIATITDSIGSVAQFTYNVTGLPLTTKDARGNTTTFAYDAYGNQTSKTDPLGRITASVYDTLGNLTSQTGPRNNTTTYVYDGYNRRTSMTDALGNITSYSYDGNGNKATETDALGRITTYTYDNANRATGMLYADGTTTSSTFDYRNKPLTETDQLGRVKKRVYDVAGQLTSMIVAFGTADAATTSHTYDLVGRKLTDTDPRGNVVTNTYDAAGRMTSTKDGIGNITQFVFDAKSQRTSMIDAKSRMTSHTYDARGRQLTTTTPDNKTVTKTFDGMAQMLSTTDEEGRTNTYGFDAASQLLTVIDALSQVTTYSYDLAGNKTSQKDANNHTTTYVFDALNRRTSRILPLGQTEATTYDAVGNKATLTDFNGKTTTFAYDSMNRQLSRTPHASFAAAPISFTYTPTGKRLTMTDTSGTTNYLYTSRDQVLSKATPQGTLSYTYDKTNNVASVISSNANGTNVAYAWDANNRLLNVTDNRTNGVTTYTYDATNQMASMLYPNGVKHGFGFDNRDRTTSLNVTSPDGMLATYLQNYGFSGHKQSVMEGSGRATNYTYDSIYRLTNESIASDPGGINGTLGYSLDAVANRLNLNSTLAPLPSQALSYDSNDRLTSDTYDANGNTLTSGTTTYTYDFEDRLLTSSAAVQITYDGDGNRVSETASGTTTKFLVDELIPTGYAQVAEELNAGIVTAQYTYGLMRISQNRTGTISYYGFDAGGSTRQLVNSTGAVTDTYTYDAFGNTVARTGTTVNPFQYRGEQFDSALGMYYLRARYYVPKTGRFLTVDKYEPELESSCCTQATSKHVELFQSTYSYVGASPIDFIDPTGNKLFDQLLIIAYGVVRFAPYVAARNVVSSAGFVYFVSPFCKFFRAYRVYILVVERATGVPSWLDAALNGVCQAAAPFN